MDLSTSTPVEIDTALAEIYGRYYSKQMDVKVHIRNVENLERGIEEEANGNRQYTGYLSMYGQEVLDLRDKIATLQDEAMSIISESVPYQAEFNRRPWSRFFLVKNNGGHIHSSMSCSTCYDTTQFGWLPDLSGQTEAEAVAAHGAILCTVCYPSAPVEWTDRRDPSACDGSGRYYDSSLPHRKGYAYGNWAECPVCHTKPALTKGMKIKKHKKA